MYNLRYRKHGLDALFPTREEKITGDINYLRGQVTMNTL